MPNRNDPNPVGKRLLTFSKYTTSAITGDTIHSVRCHHGMFSHHHQCPQQAIMRLLILWLLCLLALTDAFSSSRSFNAPVTQLSFRSEERFPLIATYDPRTVPKYPDLLRRLGTTSPTALQVTIHTILDVLYQEGLQRYLLTLILDAILPGYGIVLSVVLVGRFDLYSLVYLLSGSVWLSIIGRTLVETKLHLESHAQSQSQKEYATQLAQSDTEQLFYLFDTDRCQSLSEAQVQEALAFVSGRPPPMSPPSTTSTHRTNVSEFRVRLQEFYQTHVAVVVVQQ